MGIKNSEAASTAEVGTIELRRLSLEELLQLKDSNRSRGVPRRERPRAAGNQQERGIHRPGSQRLPI